MNKDTHNIANNYFTLLTEAKKKVNNLSDFQLNDFAKYPLQAVRHAEKTQTEWDKVPGIPKDKAQKIIDAIAKDPTAAMFYANNVMKRRWPEAEPYIATDGMAAAQYLLNYDGNINGWVGERWVDLENIDPKVAKQAEENIVRHADDIMLPAYIDIFTNRWHDFENIAFTDRANEIEGNDPEVIKQYYINHLNDLGYEDEDNEEQDEDVINDPIDFNIMTNGLDEIDAYLGYASYHKKRWPELEKVLLDNYLFDQARFYLMGILKKRWPELEEILYDPNNNDPNLPHLRKEYENALKHINYEDED